VRFSSRYSDRGKPFSACIKVNFKHIHLGCFATVKEAVQAWKSAVIHYFGRLPYSATGDPVYDENYWSQFENQHVDSSKSLFTAFYLRKRNGIPGVRFQGRGYLARINKDGVRYNLGTYRTEAEASAAWKLKALELYGFVPGVK